LAGFVRGPYTGLFILAVLTVGAAGWLQTRRRWFPLTQGAMLLSLLNLCLKPGVLRYWGDALRVMGPAQVLVLLAMVGTSALPGGTRDVEHRA
jgi:hypothetical protein